MQKILCTHIIVLNAMFSIEYVQWVSYHLLKPLHLYIHCPNLVLSLTSNVDTIKIYVL